MYRYKNILVCLNLSDLDASVIRYAGLLARTAKSERAWFIHVVSRSSLPESFVQEYPQLAPAVDDMMLQRISEAVNCEFQDADAERIPRVLQGDKLKALLATISDESVDLVIVGRKTEQSGRDSLEKQLTRRAPCSVLVVPQNSPPRITRVMCAVDFSEFSLRALDKALLYCRSLGLTTLHAVHYFSLPTGYYKTGLSAEQFAERLEPHLHREFDEFQSRVDTRDVTVERIIRRASDVAQAIRDDVHAVGADLLILGSRGRSPAASVFLGVLPEKLIWTTDIPMLVVKEKGEGAGFLKLLLDSL